MLKLPSGTIVDFSTERVRYHALRRFLNQGASHQQLYQVIDLLIAASSSGQPLPGLLGGPVKLRYSGLTLADIATQQNWSSADRRSLLTWLEQPAQRRKIEASRNRLPSAHKRLSAIAQVDHAHLYSRLQRRIERLPLQRASPQQWRATLLNLRRQGIAEEEITWSGILSRLSELADAHQWISKAQVLACIDFSPIFPELCTEMVWGNTGNLCFKEVASLLSHQTYFHDLLGLEAEYLLVLRFVDQRYRFRICAARPIGDSPHKQHAKKWFALDPCGRVIPNPQDGTRFFNDSDAARHSANQHAKDYWNITTGNCYFTRYEHLSLLEGENYREWLVILPDFQKTFYGSHFEERNVLAHVRSTDRHDQEGRRLLFIEELQSDWHTMGRKYGYDNRCGGHIPHAPFKNSWVSLACKKLLRYACEHGYDGLAWTPASVHESRYVRAIQALRRIYDQQLPRTLNRLGRHFDAQVRHTSINTKHPWLKLTQNGSKWQVTDGQGTFTTKPRYTRTEALALLARHSKQVTLDVPFFHITTAMRAQILNDGLPMFGEQLE